MKFFLAILLLVSPLARAESNFLVKGSVESLTGEVYLGGEKTSRAKFNSYSAEAQYINNGWLFGLSYDAYNNSRSVSNSQLGLNAGYNFKFNKINWSIYGGAGIATYQENSSLQAIETMSSGLRVATAVSFDIYDGLFVELNYKYLHQMFTAGPSYWGQNARTDLVFDVHGPGIGLGWRW